VSGHGLPFGATPTAEGAFFRVWAPGAERVEVVLYGPDAERVELMDAEGDGWWSAELAGAGAGSRYRYRLDGGESYADPAARSQPEGVDGPSEVMDPGAYRWRDARWRGVALEDLVIYELHVGTATEEGTFEALIPHLAELAALGVTAIELMPVASFAGARNWGYDGVFPYAPSAVYGGPEGLKRLVDAAHRDGLAVLLDVVYNHLGPAGCTLPALTGGRIFTEAHHTPWGAALRFEGEHSAPIREFFIQNALYWLREFHVDGLRLDATHAILDDSPAHLLAELAARVHSEAPRPALLIAEDERNERRLLLPPPEGFGLDAVWADDFHHSLRRLLAGDREGYYAGYEGTAQELARTTRQGWLYEGEPYAPTREPRGTPAEGIAPERFVYCIQNHDQVGNRALGERLNHEISLAAYRAASALLLLSPYTPLLFMGQEWAASTPFLYFTDHAEELGRQVTEGRRAEFGSFQAFADPEARERIPDPQAIETFLRSKLDWSERERPPHAGVLALYRKLLALREAHLALRRRHRESFSVLALGDGALALRMRGGGEELLLVACLAGVLTVPLAAHTVTAPPEGRLWGLTLATEELRFGGSGGWGRLESDGVLQLPGPGAVVLHAF
jgi:maltooligosyltrehalose trehalohydrolase